LVQGKVYPDQGKVFLVEEKLCFGLGSFVNKDFISAVTVEENCGKKLIALEMG